WIPESSRTACAKCTEKQKALVAKVIKAIQTKLPEEWEVLSLQTDPEGKLKDDLQKFLDEYAKDQEILC
ncbi:Chemosensory protein9, partial [Operophtera brumata]